MKMYIPLERGGKYMYKRSESYNGIPHSKEVEEMYNIESFNGTPLCNEVKEMNKSCGEN